MALYPGITMLISLQYINTSSNTIDLPEPRLLTLTRVLLESRIYSPAVDICPKATMGMGDYSPGSVWYYAPNKAAPVVFIILFLISGVLHAYQTMY
jgi:hypothetical protein